MLYLMFFLHYFILFLRFKDFIIVFLENRELNKRFRMPKVTKLNE